MFAFQQARPSGPRVWKQTNSAIYGVFYLYGPSGQLLYEAGPTVGPKGYVYFAGRLLYNAAGAAVYRDRLGSTRATESVGVLTARNYYPFGEEIGSPSANDAQKFADTYRDATTGLDYAQNCYYSNGAGRFLAADPYRTSGGPALPHSWNRYAYVHNDPVNYFDPLGLLEADPEPPPTGDPGISRGFGMHVYRDAEGTFMGASFVQAPGGSRGRGTPPGTGGTTGTAGTRGNFVKPIKDLAIDTLGKNQACRDLVGGEDAAATLEGMSILPADLGQTTITAEGKDKATIEFTNAQWKPQDENTIWVNTNGGLFTNPGSVSATYFQQGRAPRQVGVNILRQVFGNQLTAEQYQATIVLHELAHRMGAFGPEGRNVEASLKNTLRVAEACFGLKR